MNYVCILLYQIPFIMQPRTNYRILYYYLYHIPPQSYNIVISSYNTNHPVALPCNPWDGWLMTVFIRVKFCLPPPSLPLCSNVIITILFYSSVKNMSHSVLNSCQKVTERVRNMNVFQKIQQFPLILLVLVKGTSYVVMSAYDNSQLVLYSFNSFMKYLLSEC